MNEQIQLNLKDFGLNDNEIKIYLSLLRLGASSVLDLAKSTKLNRTTVHVNTESLIQKGLATQLKRGARRQITAEPPEKLKLLLENEKLQLSKKEEILGSLIGTINLNISDIKENTQSEVRYYEGRDAVARVYDDILSYPEIRTYVSPMVLQKFLPENQQKFIDAVKLHRREIWDLQDYDDKDDIFIDLNGHEDKYHLKYFPRTMKIFGMDYLIYGDSITIVQGGDDVSAIVIKSKALAENSKAIYDLLWGLLP